MSILSSYRFCYFKIYNEKGSKYFRITLTPLVIQIMETLSLKLKINLYLCFQLISKETATTVLIDKIESVRTKILIILIVS
jgi:hypothetical protein